MYCDHDHHCMNYVSLKDWTKVQSFYLLLNFTLTDVSLVHYLLSSAWSAYVRQRNVYMNNYCKASSANKD